jgi:protocatechuate 3,4-dioxygenase beta subunit
MPKHPSKRRSHHRRPTLHIGGDLPTPSDVLGPFYRKGAPFQTDIAPPVAKGTALVISGIVHGLGARKPLANALLDIWQANADGHYDNDDPSHPPPPNVFTDRARLRTDRHGSYEFRTVYPGAYKMDATTWRTPHIHYKVEARGYATLVTQLFFDGAPYLATDPFVEKELIIALRALQGDRGPYWSGTFDIVLARHKRRTRTKRRR